MSVFIHIPVNFFFTYSGLAFANSVDPDLLATEEAKWSGSALFVMKYVNLYQQLGSVNFLG